MSLNRRDFLTRTTASLSGLAAASLSAGECLATNVLADEFPGIPRVDAHLHCFAGTKSMCDWPTVIRSPTFSGVRPVMA